MFKQFHYGVCYYPEHWEARRHASDIRRIAACGFNLVRLGEGAWSYFEPQEGRFQFELFDHVIDLCREHGIKVIMGTPTYCAPAWVSARYPEVLRWNFQRIPMTHGSRRNLNYTSAKYLELSDRICTALAEHYRAESQIIGWQLDNEFNCHMDTSYAPSDTLAFRQWLKDKYRTIERLNRAWGTAFWSQTYDDWKQLDLPHPTATYLNPSQVLDETRFISDMVIRFARRQADILRRANRRWQITHNALFANIDGPAFVKVLDFFSQDQYPLFWPDEDWTGPAANLQLARSLSFPYGVLEQQSGPGGQMQYLQRTPRAGQLRLWAWQSIAHGAKLLSYFRWRTCPYGSEQHWHGLLDQDDRDNRRIAEAKQVGTEIGRLPADFFDAPVARAVAVMRDFDNEANDRRINTYTHDGRNETAAWLDAISRAHISGDVVWPTSDLAGYPLLIAPHLKIVDRAVVRTLSDFVESGGTLVLGAQSGAKDNNNHIVEMPLPGLLRKLAGVEVQDWTTLADQQVRSMRLIDGRLAPMRSFVERLRPRSAEPVAWWMSGDSLLEDSPAITRNRIGRGSVYYVGGYCTPAAVSALLQHLMHELELRPIIQAPDCVEAISRGTGRRRYTILLNHSAASQRISGITGTELLSDRSVPVTGLVLGPYGVAIVRP